MQKYHLCNTVMILQITCMIIIKHYYSNTEDASLLKRRVDPKMFKAICVCLKRHWINVIFKNWEYNLFSLLVLSAYIEY